MNCAVWTWVFLLPILASIGALSEDQDGVAGNSTELANLSNTSYSTPTLSITVDTEQIENNVTVTEDPMLSIPKSVSVQNASTEDLGINSDANYSIESNETTLIQNLIPPTNATLEHTLAFDQAKNVTNSTLELGVTSFNDSTEPMVSSTSSWITPSSSSITSRYSQSTVPDFQVQQSTLPNDVAVNTVRNDTTAPIIDTTPAIIDTTTATIGTTVETIVTTRTELAPNVSETVAVPTVENSTVSTQLPVEPTLENPTRHVATVSTLPATEHNVNTAISSNYVKVSNSTVTTEMLPVSQTFPTSNDVRTTAAATNEEMHTTTGNNDVDVTTTLIPTTTFPSTTTGSTIVEIVKNFDELSEVEFFNTATVILDVPSSMEWYEKDHERFRISVACLLNYYSKKMRMSSNQPFKAEDVVIVLPSPRIADKKLIVCFFVRNSTRTKTVTSRRLITESLKKFTEKFESWVGINVSDFYGGIKLTTLLWPSSAALTSNVFERNYLLLLIVSAVASTCVLSLLFGIIYVRCCRTRASRRHSDSAGQYESSGKGANIDKVCLTNGDRKSTISNTEDEGWVFPYEQFLSMNREDNTDNTRL